MTSWWFALWLHRTPSLSKRLRWPSEKMRKSVPFPSSAPEGRHPLWTPPRSSESFPYSTLSSSDCQKNSFHFIPQQIKNTNLYRQCVGAWVLPTWEFSIFSCPIPTISYQRMSFTPRALLIVEAARIFILATWPFTKSYKIFSLQKRKQRVDRKCISSWEAFLSVPSDAIRKFERARVLQLYFHVPKPLFQCHSHEEMNLPGKLLDRKENLHSESSYTCKKRRKNSSFCYRKRIFVNLKPMIKTIFNKPSRDTVEKALLKRVCNHGTAAIMAVTVLLGKTLASSRRLDSVLDTSRLKHTVILVNPRLRMVRMLKTVPAVPKQNQHLKGYWSTCKDHFIVPRYYMLRKKKLYWPWTMALRPLGELL